MKIKLQDKVRTINEKKLCKLINNDHLNVVNLFDDHFQYCNGYIIVNCTYEHYEVIQKLFKIGAIKNFRDWMPEKTCDLSETVNCQQEVEAIKTPYLKVSSRGYINIFKIDGKYYLYNKEFIDVFSEEATFKANMNGINGVPLLRVYVWGKLIGIVLGIIAGGIDDEINELEKN